MTDVLTDMDKIQRKLESAYQSLKDARRLWEDMPEAVKASAPELAEVWGGTQG